MSSPTVKEVFDTFTDEQKDAADVFIKALAGSRSKNTDPINSIDSVNETLKTLNETQWHVLFMLLGYVLDTKKRK